MGIRGCSKVDLLRMAQTLISVSYFKWPWRSAAKPFPVLDLQECHISRGGDVNNLIKVKCMSLVEHAFPQSHSYNLA